MFEPKLATEIDINAVNQLIRISTNLILANIIQSRNPSLTLLQCKLEASKQYAVALDEGWQG